MFRTKKAAKSFWVFTRLPAFWHVLTQSDVCMFAFSNLQERPRYVTQVEAPDLRTLATCLKEETALRGLAF